MKKIAISVILAVVLVGLLTTPILAKDLEKGKSAMSGKSDTGHLYLFEKDPADWSLVVDGAWGKFNYKLSGSGSETEVSGVFNGHGLVPGTEYTLINYVEPALNPWPDGGVAVVVLGNGKVNDGGDIHISAQGTIGEPDEQPAIGDYVGQTGDKIWLVLTTDITQLAEPDADGYTSHITGWNPTEYLFEYRLINTGTP